MKIKKIKISRIEPDPNQPRRRFDKAKIETLAQSIRIHGLMQPISVRPHPQPRKGWIITSGERRWRAHKLLVEQGMSNFEEIAASVSLQDDATKTVAAIAENIHRTDLDPIEEAAALSRALPYVGGCCSTLAKNLAVSESRVQNRLALLALDGDIQGLVSTGDLDLSMGVELSRLDRMTQRAMVIRIARGELRTLADVKGAVATVLELLAQTSFLNEPIATHADAVIANSVEARVDRMITLIGTGWKTGDSASLAKISPARTILAADKIAAIQYQLKLMEQQLRSAAIRQSETARHAAGISTLEPEREIASA